MEYFVAFIQIYLSVSESDIGAPVTFKTKLFETTVKSFQPLLIFCYKENHLRCYIGLELNIVTWFKKILKGIGEHPPCAIATLGEYEKFTLLDALKIHSQCFFTLSFLHLIPNGLNGVNNNSFTYIVALL